MLHDAVRSTRAELLRDNATLFRDLDEATEVLRRACAVVDRLIPQLPLVIPHTYNDPDPAVMVEWSRRRNARLALHNEVLPRIKAKIAERNWWGRVKAPVLRAQGMVS